MKVLITPRGFANNGMKFIKEMEKKGLEVNYNDTGLSYSAEHFLNLAKNSDAIIVGVDTIDRKVIDSCPKLKVICKFGVGTDNIDVEYAKEKGIFVGRTVGSNSNSVAEHVMSYIYCDSKNLFNSIKEVKNHQWNKYTGREIDKKTLGIIGFGAIGKHLAKQATGVGMNVLVHDVFDISNEEQSEYNVQQENLENILKKSDYISLHLPLTKSTEDLISKKELNMMKENSCLINAARGGIVNENDLYEALTKGEIRSAFFDVFSTEPPASDNKLLALNNFFLTPHTGARTTEADIRTCGMSAQIIMDKLNKF
ncbi:phosphoglycerate dehydrogenase [Companilactobacillus sp. HBUAS59544]|jgi:D-3-phosphoglycerate dehydrogenase|uniref:phosphoglycerate dehydrogenase n=1 Tax=Companilactobacillus sp. HBUAS59544 TaxID=3109363 RepID=UPI002FEF36E9